MSGVFDKFMGSYVLLERRNLEELLQKLAQVNEECSYPPFSFFLPRYFLVHLFVHNGPFFLPFDLLALPPCCFLLTLLSHSPFSFLLSF